MTKKMEWRVRMGVFYEIDRNFYGEITPLIEAEIELAVAGYHPEVKPTDECDGLHVNAQVKPYEDGEIVEARLNLIKAKYNLY